MFRCLRLAGQLPVMVLPETEMFPERVDDAATAIAGRIAVRVLLVTETLP